MRKMGTDRRHFYQVFLPLFSYINACTHIERKWVGPADNLLYSSPVARIERHNDDDSLLLLPMQSEEDPTGRRSQ